MVTGVNISDKAQHEQAITGACATPGIDPSKLKIKNGRGDVDLIRFANVLVDQVQAISSEIVQYQRFA